MPAAHPIRGDRRLNSFSERIQHLVRNDPVRWQVLAQVSTLQLPDCWVGAGFVRNLVWDHLHGRAHSPLSTDVDVLWFNPACVDAQQDRALKAQLQALAPGITWSVKNQARMHVRNGDAPYRDTADAMRYWPETATAVAVRRTPDDHCEVSAPLGVDDLFALVLRPTARYVSEKHMVYASRITGKGWLDTWPLLRCEGP